MPYGLTIGMEARLLADTIRTAPEASVRKYPNWDLTQLGRHVAEIHGWVMAIVRDRALERSPRLELTSVPAREVADVLEAGAAELGAVLDNCDEAATVWTFAGDGTNGFWCRRMVLEATIHRWDAQDALGNVPYVSDAVALDGLREWQSTYSARALPEWTVSCESASLSVINGLEACTMSGSPLGMWLFVMGRRKLDSLKITGDGAFAAQVATKLADAPGPG